MFANQLERKTPRPDSPSIGDQTNVTNEAQATTEPQATTLKSLAPGLQHYAHDATIAGPVGGNRGRSRFPGGKSRLGLTLPVSSIPDEASQGALVGSGLAGEVREDPDNNGFVVKSGAWTREEAEQESELFNRFYGEHSSEVFEKNGRVFMRMLRVPGRPLSQLLPGDLPDNSRLLFAQMICDLNDLKIIHGDLHSGNVMYDKETNRFWPIDLSNSYDSYYAYTGDPYLLDLDNIRRFEQIMRKLPPMPSNDAS